MNFFKLMKAETLNFVKKKTQEYKVAKMFKNELKSAFRDF